MVFGGFYVMFRYINMFSVYGIIDGFYVMFRYINMFSVYDIICLYCCSHRYRRPRLLTYT